MTIWELTKAKIAKVLGAEELPMDQAMDELGMPGVWAYFRGRTAYIHITHPSREDELQASGWIFGDRNHFINTRTGANAEAEV